MQEQIIRPREQVERATRMSGADDMLRSVTPFLALGYAESLDPERLREALARVLSDYSVFSGRWRSAAGVQSIVHGAGVPFETVTSRDSLSALIARANAGDASIVCSRIAAMRAPQGRLPLFRVRATRTPDGTLIGLTWHHPLGDVHSVSTFLRAWALAYRGAPFEPPFPIEDRERYLNERLPDPPSVQPSARLLGVWPWLTVMGHVLSTRTRRLHVEFSPRDLARIHAAAGGRRPVSVNDALCAHLGLVMRTLLGTREPSQVVATVNYRKRMGLPAGFVGNPLSVLPVDIAAADDRSSVAARMRTQLDAFASEFLDHHANRRVAAGAHSAFEKLRLVLAHFDPWRGNLFFSSWTNFGLGELAFGHHKPAHIFCRAAEFPWFGTLYEGPQPGGVTFSALLPKALVERARAPENRALLHGSELQGVVPAEPAAAGAQQSTSAL